MVALTGNVVNTAVLPAIFEKNGGNDRIYRKIGDHYVSKA